MTQCRCTEGSQREGGTSEVEETRLSVHVVRWRKWRTKACSRIGGRAISKCGQFFRKGLKEEDKS